MPRVKKKSQIHNLPCSLKKLEKEGQATPPAIRRKEITKHSVEMNREQENIRENQPKRWFFKKFNRNDKSLARLTVKKNREDSNYKNQESKGDITIDLT